MRYTIVINQFAIEHHKLGLTIEEVVILDYLYWLCKSDNIKLIRLNVDDLVYTWFDYNYFLKQNPLIHWKSKGCLTTRLYKLEKEGFIKTKISGDYSNRKYVTTLSKIELIYGNEHNKKVNEKIIENEKCEWCNNTILPLVNHHFPISSARHGTKTVKICTACHTIYHNTDTTLTAEQRKQYTVSKVKQMLFPPIHLDESIIIDNNNNNKNNNTINISKTLPHNSIYKLYLEKINSKARLTPGSIKKIQTRLKEYSPEDLKKAIVNFSRDTWWMKNNAHRGVAWFFHTEDRIDQFLNLKECSKKTKYSEYDEGTITLND